MATSRVTQTFRQRKSRRGFFIILAPFEWKGNPDRHAGLRSIDAAAIGDRRHDGRRPGIKSTAKMSAVDFDRLNIDHNAKMQMQSLHDTVYNYLHKKKKLFYTEPVNLFNPKARIARIMVGEKTTRERKKRNDVKREDAHQKLSQFNIADVDSFLNHLNEYDKTGYPVGINPSKQADIDDNADEELNKLDAYLLDEFKKRIRESPKIKSLIDEVSRVLSVQALKQAELTKKSTSEQ